MPVKTHIKDGVAVVELHLGRGNAINQTFIDEILPALDEVERSSARVAVITGEGRTFCGGLDLVTIYDFDRPAMSRFVDAFEAMFRRVFSFPMPTIAAINGHAIAGGCILAMACNERVMSRGPHRIGATEVLLGIPFPAAAFEIMHDATPIAARGAVFLEGRRFTPEEALEKGLVHRLSEEQDAVAEAVDDAHTLWTGTRAALADTKADLCAPVLERIDASSARRRERFLDRWFSAEARARVGQIRSDLLKKRAAK